MTMLTITGPAETLSAAVDFIGLEADMLDHGEYDAWLALWADDAQYVVPIDLDATDFASTLNYALADKAQLAKRVEKMSDGFSVAASPPARTVRSLSRFRLLENGSDLVRVRCAQIVTAHRRETQRTYTGNVEYTLRRVGDAWQIVQKVVRLINAGDPLTAISYIL